MKNYKELIIWQKGIEIVKRIYGFANKFPDEEKFGIVAQMTKAAVSIPANIAEGSSRNSDKDYVRFLQISLGSVFEVQTYLIIAKEMNWLMVEEIKDIETLLEEEIKMIHRFINTLNKANS
ncbi:four helix bundle protein [Limnovirga soli]|uniref:Four helix bundle protein n=1 Tax=Limnovirga soli TaxID=2656915 RepID=A0A8J8JSV1_9BACT|nr:four helix bundle protein [Limnovirga soli]NNV55143.1 four helix bundle protein [Limnovirga soli]